MRCATYPSLDDPSASLDDPDAAEAALPAYETNPDCNLRLLNHPQTRFPKIQNGTCLLPWDGSEAEKLRPSLVTFSYLINA